MLFVVEVVVVAVTSSVVRSGNEDVTAAGLGDEAEQMESSAEDEADDESSLENSTSAKGAWPRRV